MKITADHSTSITTLTRRMGLGAIPKIKPSKKVRRASTQRPLTDEEIQSAFKAGFRVHDKQRGIYVHI